MSIHKSLVIKSGLVRYRNVLKRYERVLAMQGQGTWEEKTPSVFGLPKLRVAKKIKKAKGGKGKKGKEGEEAKK